MPQPAPNRNTFYAQTFVDALVRSGLDAVCIAPGSRSTPLTLAFAERAREVGDVRVYSHLDERSAGFFALGMSMASGRPTALVCTSGTAAANFFPAIIEANMSRVPLIVLTADRPHELRHSGANQTIDQVKLYGDHVLWFVDMALPEANPPAVAVRNVRTTAARAFATAMGRMEWRRKGVVHLNFPFRKPLEPVEVAGDIEGKSGMQETRIFAETTINSIPSRPIIESIKPLVDAINKAERGIIVCGPMPHEQDFPETARQILSLSSTLGYPVVADVLSGFRYEYPAAIGGYETIFSGGEADILPEPEIVLQFGNVPVSKWLNTYLERINPDNRVFVANDGVWANDTHQFTDVVPASIHYFVSVLTFARHERRRDIGEANYLSHWIDLERQFWPIMNKYSKAEYFDGAAVAKTLETMPSGSYVFVGNSSLIRHVDQFFQPVAPDVTHHRCIFASRGASGIDGQVSTALGIGAATGEHVYAILGDITFYHDMNGLLAVRRNGISATFIVINNNGGGIFERLPIRDFEPYHTEQFLTPHGLTFEHAAAMYGLEYAVADDFESLDAALDQYMKPGVSAIIEVKTDIKRDEARRKEIVKAVQDELRKQFGRDKN